MVTKIVWLPACYCGWEGKKTTDANDRDRQLLEHARDCCQAHKMLNLGQTRLAIFYPTERR